MLAPRGVYVLHRERRETGVYGDILGCAEDSRAQGGPDPPADKEEIVSTRIDTHLETCAH